MAAHATNEIIWRRPGAISVEQNLAGQAGPSKLSALLYSSGKSKWQPLLLNTTVQR